MSKNGRFTKMLALLAVLALPATLQAQFQWSKGIASANNWPGGEPNTGLALDTNDNCYVTGFFDDTNNFGGVTLTNQSSGGSDIYVAKYNSTGALQWVQQAGESAGNANCGRGVGTDTNGNIYVAGAYQGPAKFGSVNLSTTPGEEFFLAKYNSAGTVQWVQTSTGSGPDNSGIGLTVDSVGNSYALAVMDYSGTSITFGTKTVTSVKGGTTFTILVKYDNTGAAQWAQLFDSSQETWATKLAVDAAGNVYVRGMFESDMTIGGSNLTATAGAAENMFIAKFNSSGTLTWIQQPQGDSNTGEGGVAVDPLGNVFISGAFTTNLNFGGGIILTNSANASAPFGDAFLAKYNSAGVIQWARLAGGVNGGFYWDLGLDAQTNIYAAGVSGLNAAVAKYSPAGMLQWTYSASGPTGSPVSSGASKCAVDATGHCYLNGFYQGTATFGTNTLQPQETWNFFLTETITNPTVKFTAAPTGGALPLMVQFNSTNLDSQGNTVTSWNWNFGDGGTSIAQNPSHTYTNIGTFNPTFMATNNHNVMVVGYGPQITATTVNPTISTAASPTNGAPPLTVQFSSTNVDGFGNPVTNWSWSFGDGATSTLENPSHTYTNAGIFLPVLLATNSLGGIVNGYGPQIATVTPTPSTCLAYYTNNGTITITGYSCPDGALNIPALINGLPVTSIGDNAFNNNSYIYNRLTSLVIPSSVTYVGNHAFDSCFDITNVIIGNSVTYIGNWAFSEVGGGNSAFNVIIPNSVTTMGTGAFNGCPMTSISFSSNLTNLESGALFVCYNLTNITVDALNPVYASVGGVLFSKDLTTLIAYPPALTGNYIIPTTVTTLGVGSFNFCRLAAVTISSNVTSIESGAFENCYMLTNFTVDPMNPAYASKGGVLFNKNLTTLIQYPDGLTGAYLIPISVTSIGAYAFYDDYNLASITFPNNIISIGSSAFAYSSLTAAYFQGNAPGGDSTVFLGDTGTAYYLPGTTGWSSTFGGWPTALWYQSNPLILTSANGTTNLGVKNNQFGFTVSWATNRSVVVQAATNLANAHWIPVATNALVNGTNYFSDPQWTNYHSRFYRLSAP